MNISAVKTRRISAQDTSIIAIIDEALPVVREGSIIAVTSKIVSICEGSIVARDDIDKEALIKRQADLYLSADNSKYGHHFTVTNNTLIASAGIDESNGEGYYILWPKDSQATANAVRSHLAQKHGIQHVGVVITDSTCQPLRRGTSGIFLAHSGFAALRDYRGLPDLFDNLLAVTQSNIAGGLAAAAVLAMGEGSEQTPLCLISEVPNISFQPRDPTPAELQEITITLEDDLFAPFLTAVPWQRGTHL